MQLSILTLKESSTLLLFRIFTNWPSLRYAYVPSLAFVLLLLANIARAQTCTLSLKPTVSGCYQKGGQSKAVVSLELIWSNPPAGDSILVQGPAGSIPASRVIKTGLITVRYEGVRTAKQTIVSPQVVAFEIPANGATGLTATAKFLNRTTCSATSPTFAAPAACPPTACATGQLGGTIFNDFDADGIKAKGETTGLVGITVKAFDCNGVLVATTTSDIYGEYSFKTLTAANYPLRVEFSTLPAVYGQGTNNGRNGRTTVQFVSAPNCNVDLGVLNPTDFCQNNPSVFVPCYVSGNPLPVGAKAGKLDALVSFNYRTTGLADMAKVNHLSNADQVGSLWGVAYNKFNKKLYSSAILRRHTGLGPKGLGGLYTTDVTTNITTSFDLATIGINVGTIGSNAARGLDDDPGQPSRDPSAFPAIGKIGLGDLDISENGKFLYVVSLTDKKLNKIDITGA